MDKEREQKNKALDLALTQIERTYGKGSIMRFGEQVSYGDIMVIPTGALSLDYALGVWGYPRGRVIEIFGPESSGKTTLALHAVANAQAAGGVAAFIDAEHALDPVYCRNLGVKLDELLISQPDTGEQALDIAETLVRSNAVDIVVIDSVAALVPKAELEGEMGDAHVGLQARLMSQALRKLTASISRSKTCLIFINQVREKIGVMFGSNETTPGGRALKFYASVRVDVRRIGSLKEQDEVIGNQVRAKVVKNKISPPFRNAEFDIIFGKGISREGDLIDLGVLHKAIEKTGAWFSYDGTRLGQGRENTRRFLKDNPQVAAKLEDQIKTILTTVKPSASKAEIKAIDNA
ncbi:MAG TPA: recombinase RecA [Candidatus Sumerlaeota bacterium]|nr:recombinase RecA [Candidatus Sumerlaeota bacterium]HRR31816.1 recombinase RecA [Candidatus Sumerlaeia bacterium]HON51153.1 recombinase RecA [Candidatus Sumerlaeota bacterium]HOR64968.1 recombinase RecA [Candidatus Sumerlaeota bacterium]HPL75020.1 recombinase RecA [Candidatus Sumerlaeota bacterium]